MRILLSLLFILPISVQASNNLRFEDTEISFEKPIQFQFLAQTGAFVGETAEGRLTVIRKAPGVMVNQPSVKRMWEQNLAGVGEKANSGDCSEISKGKKDKRFFCERKTKDKTHYMSWSKKDLIYILASGSNQVALKPEFTLLKVKK